MKNIIEAFKVDIREAGIHPPAVVIGDGRLHRFHVPGDKPGTLNGWYKLYLNGRATGFFGNWKQGIKCCWKMDGEFKPLTLAERQAFAIECQRQEAERRAAAAKRHGEAAKKAAYIWSRSTPAESHAYLIKKGVKSHAARCYRGSLVLPLYDENRVVVSLQFIGDDGTKRLMKDGIAQGSHCWIGDLEPGGTILICEGWATGASLYEATGNFTVIAFFAENLKAVAELIRKHHKEHPIVICGDNDENGTGQRTARAAALAVGGAYLIPAQAGKDWNDVLTEAGGKP